MSGSDLIKKLEEADGSLRPSAFVPGCEGGETATLRLALRGLLNACLSADAEGELPEHIDGSLLDAAQDALDLQHPVIWTAEQVAMLEARQADPTAHPYTCGGDRGDALHTAQAEEDGDEQPGRLIPTARGWICPACDYRQFWSHETGRPADSSDSPSPRSVGMSEANEPSQSSQEGRP